MKKLFYLPALFLALAINSCGGQASEIMSATSDSQGQGQSAVEDDDSNSNVVQVAVGSPDHTILVSSLKSADYVNVLTNVGPFTVFAPTNAAFDALPAGILDDLTKPENQRKLRNILEYHVLLGVYKHESFINGRNLGTADGRSVSVIVAEDGSVSINGAKIIATVAASNGIIHVIDQVLLPN
ncbi:fasciclin domain-containing protein [Algoriphagus yeomjeoni]|uniref:fasciclin domain-containing protein n=1 Tax=Algoriphagus yeomjeoni TaxID=291403 RepID=UPI003CE52106